jgi:Formate/nitrite transporter
MTELAAQPIRRATSLRDNVAPSNFNARLRRSESNSAEPFGRIWTSHRFQVHYCIILCEVNKELLQEAVQLVKRKSDLPIRDMLIRGILAGAFLGYATSLVFMVSSQGLPPIAGAILFPVGFVMLALLGLELVTGNFALLLAGVMAGTVGVTRLLATGLGCMPET